MEEIRRHRSKQKAFTLIELLFVVAIISLILSIVLAALSVARRKANDTALKQSLHEARNQAELYHTDNQNYGISSFDAGPCDGPNTNTVFADPKILEILRAAGNITGGMNVLTCASSPTSWAISVPMQDTDGYWCVDNTGNAIERSSVLGPIVGPSC